jgi:hypothetical protein
MVRRWPCWVLGLAILWSTVIAFTCFYPRGPLNSVGALVTGILSVAHAEESAKEAAISEFRALPRHKAVRLTWKARIAEEDQLTFEIHRSMVTPEGAYTLVTSIKGKPGTRTYRYVDKAIPAEENYFYKIVIQETKETIGPVQVRPPFSLPST